jgi:ATP-dependent Clp protease ATP-binding subunit ClpA
LSLREAIALGHNYIGTEHILLGLVRENEGAAARILLDFDTDAEKIRNEIIRTLSGEAGLERAEHEVADVELTSPPLASEVLAELGRLAAENDAALARQAFEEAASLRDAERRLHLAAAGSSVSGGGLHATRSEGSARASMQV